MNNAIFGKTMENVRNHVDVKLLTKWDVGSVFTKNLVIVELHKLEVKFNKPIYVGMCILDLSKIYLYEFYYEYMFPLYRDKCKIMYTDTDSVSYITSSARIFTRR